jgi:arginyl-tRNA synthetase
VAIFAKFLINSPIVFNKIVLFFQIMDFKDQLIKILVKETGLNKEEISNLLAIPPDQKLGDYAFPCFKLGNSSKSMGFSQNPKEAAEQLKEKLEKSKLPKFLHKTQVVGPYLNFFLEPVILAKIVLSKINLEEKDYGKQNFGKGKTIVIDFSSPNIAKPFGIGHLRSTVIGNALYKVCQKIGYNVVGVNHLGDWGTQFGKLIVAYQKWGEEKKLEKDPIKYLLKLYVKFHKEEETNIDLTESARETFKKLEEGDKDLLKIWQLFRDLSLLEFKRVYQILDVDFDSYNGEAFYNDKANTTIKQFEKKKLTKISEGALIIDLEKYKMPPILLRKSNGATTYHTRDLSTVFYRMKEYNPDEILYAVGSPQKLHFQQLFKALELVGSDKAKFVHVDFGHFHFKEGKMSTRKGNIIFLEEVLDKAISLALKAINEKNPDLKDKCKVAKDVGVGAIIFSDLSTDRSREVLFDWDKVLSFEGETGPYLQYTYARSSSILRKAKVNFNELVLPEVQFDLLTLNEEQAIIKKLAEFPQILIKVKESYKPHHLANYLIVLAQLFNEFYHKCPVLCDQTKQRKARLLLVDGVRQVLSNGLTLLGMRAPEEM